MGDAKQKAAILDVLKQDKLIDDDDDYNSYRDGKADITGALDNDPTGIGNQANDIDISDDEAPDVEDAKNKIRQQNQ